LNIYLMQYIFSWQAQTFDTPPTYARVFLKNKQKEDGNYANEATRERWVGYSSFCG